MFLIPCVLFPFLGLIFCVKFLGWEFKADEYGRNKTIIYPAICIPAISLIYLLVNLLGSKFHSSFYEVWNFKVLNVQHYEAWDEEVHCRHPIEVTTTHTDSKGNTYTTTTIVGYYHPYDVDYHPEFWQANHDGDSYFSISQQEYLYWKGLWGNDSFHDLHRYYHSINGNMFQSNWNNKFDTIFPHSDISSYENRIRVSKSVFNFKTPTKEEVKKYPRPADSGITKAVFGYGIDIRNEDELKIRRVNALLGVQKKIHVILMLYDASLYGQDEVETVKSAWQGPNKNELVIFIGLDKKTNTVGWCDVISWCDDTAIHSLIRQDLFEKNKFSFDTVSQVLRNRIPDGWVKKDFHSFDYLTVQVPTGCIIFDYIVAVGISVGLIFAMENQ